MDDHRERIANVPNSVIDLCEVCRQREAFKSTGTGKLICEPCLKKSQGIFTVKRARETIGRNWPCPCSSGKKFKHCCYNKSQV